MPTLAIGIPTFIVGDSSGFCSLFTICEVVFYFNVSAIHTIGEKKYLAERRQFWGLSPDQFSKSCQIHCG
jgi:hypothetical protein